MLWSDTIHETARSGKARYGISILWTWNTASRVRDSQVQSYLYKRIRDTYVTFNKSVVEDTSSSTFRLNQWYLK